MFRQARREWIVSVVAVVGLGFGLPVTASAEEPRAIVVLEPAGTVEVEASVSLRPGFGVRIGGTGYRNVTGADTSWTDYRMDGFGAFATLEMNGLFFGELGLDFYSSTGSSIDKTGFDRTSISLLGAIGVKPFPGALFRPFVQLGVGAEYARSTWSYFGREENRVFPVGFAGVGGEFGLGDHVSLGMNARLFVLATPVVAGAAFGPDEGGYVHLPGEFEPGMAGQLQFFARFDL